MNSLGIFYATISGSTKRVAHLIADRLLSSAKHVHNISDVPVESMLDYQFLILGTPTYGKGDLHYMWDEVFDEMSDYNFREKGFALFCLGDQRFHGETFAGSMEKMHNRLLAHSSNIIGKWGNSYSFKSNPSLLSDGSFYGLIIDEVNQQELTSERIKGWSDQLSAGIILNRSGTKVEASNYPLVHTSKKYGSSDVVRKLN